MLSPSVNGASMIAEKTIRFFATYAFSDPLKFFEIDAEGFEGAVIEGMRRLLSKPGRKVPILCEILTDRERAVPLDGAQIIRRLEGFGYRCLNAPSLQPIDPSSLRFEENILCV
jgi:hypothetical protein